MNCDSCSREIDKGLYCSECRKGCYWGLFGLAVLGLLICYAVRYV